jgi:peptidyl-prolyl cis-trans isomerase B (cyclophilin B)
MNRLRCLLYLISVLLTCSVTVWASPQEIDLTQQVVISSSEGTFVLSLYPDKAPLHAKLFLSRVAAGAYDGASFGHVVKWGMIQGGARLPKGEGQTIAPDPVTLGEVRAESSGLTHGRGALSLVLDQGDSYSGQFFICVTPQPGLDGRYTPIGFVAEGIEVVDKISETPVDERGVPVQRARIEKATLRHGRPKPPPPFAEMPPAELGQYRATLDTSLGNITLEFFPDLAPNHVRNFLRLAQAGFYDGTAIHRVVRDFVMQGGLLSTRQPPLPYFRIADLVEKLKPEFNDTRHVKGIVSMARYDEPDSAETSFFICLGNASNLDGQYTAFGKVVEGVEILERFQDVTVDGEAPKERLELKKVTVAKKRPGPGAP